MSVLLIVRPKCTVRWPRRTLFPGESVTVSMPTGQTDGWTPDRYITLSAMDAVSVMSQLVK